MMVWPLAIARSSRLVDDVSMQNDFPHPEGQPPREEQIPPPPGAPGREQAGFQAGIIPKPNAAEAVSSSWQSAWRLLRSDPVALPLAAIIASVLGSVTLGILAGPLAWGVLAMCFARMRANAAMQVGQVFGQFDRVGTSIGIALLGGLAVIVGLALLVIPGLYLVVAFMYALPIGLDERIGAVDALKESRRRVHESGFWPHAAIMATLLVTGWVLGELLDWVGSLLTSIVMVPVVASAYEHYIRRIVVPSTH